MLLFPQKGACGQGLRDLSIIAMVLAAMTTLYFLTRESQSGVPASHADFDSSAKPTAMDKDMPQDYNSLVTMANELMDRESYAMAAESYKRALELNGLSPDVRTDYGACLHAMGLPLRALEEFKRVVEEHPEHTIVNFNLGLVYSQMDIKDSARHYWQRFLDLDSTGPISDMTRRYLRELEARTY
jgi:Tfp pilus assembly protein PilF